MLRIGICDDESGARDGLQAEIEKLLDDNEEKVVYSFVSGRNAAGWISRHPGEIDLLFLDVKMPHMNGIEAARIIREQDRNIMIVLVTAYDDYVFDGYKVGALDYIMKPVSSTGIRELLDRVRKLMKGTEEEMFALRNVQGTYRFPLKDILWFYSDRRRVILVTEKGEYPFYDRLDMVEKRLGDRFVRIHQRYLVNPCKVDHVGGSAVDIGSVSLPISRSLRDKASARLAEAVISSGGGIKSDGDDSSASHYSGL